MYVLGDILDFQTLHLRQIHGFGKAKFTYVVIEFSNLSDVAYVHITQLNTPITLLLVDDKGKHPIQKTKPSNMIYHNINQTKPIHL